MVILSYIVNLRPECGLFIKHTQIHKHTRSHEAVNVVPMKTRLWDDCFYVKKETVEKRNSQAYSGSRLLHSCMLSIISMCIYTPDKYMCMYMCALTCVGACISYDREQVQSNTISWLTIYGIFFSSNYSSLSLRISLERSLLLGGKFLAMSRLFPTPVPLVNGFFTSCILSTWLWASYVNFLYPIVSK